MGEPIRVRAGKIEFVLLPDLYYTETDEWVRVEDDTAVVGITDYAQKKLHDIVGVELPEVGSSVKRGEAVAVVESVKHAADVYAPVSGEVVEVNEDLYDEPELINKDPYGRGWLFKVKMSDPGELRELLDYEAYARLVRERES